MSALPSAPPRPKFLPLVPAGVPAGLTNLNQWLVTRITWDGVRWTKPPISISLGYTVDKKDEAHWTPFDTAADAVLWGNRGFDAVGFSVKQSNGIVILDLDHCRDPETGKIDAWAKETIRLFPDSYVEPSISGTGIRIAVYGAIPENAGKRTGVAKFYPDAQPNAQIEWNSDGAFFTINGNAIDDGHTEMGEGQAGIDAVAAMFWPAKQERPAAPHLHIVLNDDDARARLAKAREASTGADFVRLYDHGDIAGFTSHSEARWALLGDLVFWLGRDQSRIDEAYRASALYGNHPDQAKKWDRLGATEISKRIEAKHDVYTPPVRVDVTAQDLPRVDTGANDLVGDLVENGLPADIDACHALIIDLAQALNAQMGLTEDYRTLARSLADSVQKVAVEHDVKQRIVKNKGLGTERFTIAHLVDHVDKRSAEADADGFIPAPYETLASNTGFSATSVRKHIERSTELGLIEKKVKVVPGRLDPKTGELGETRKVTFIRPATNVIDFAEAAASIASEQKKNHGGDSRRFGCVAHPDADIIVTTRTTKHCSVCHVELDQPTVTRRRIKPEHLGANDLAGDLVGDLAPTGTDGGQNDFGSRSNVCEVPYTVAESTICHNEQAQMEIAPPPGTLAAEWARPKETPGFDRWTQT